MKVNRNHFIPIPRDDMMKKPANDDELYAK